MKWKRYIGGDDHPKEIPSTIMPYDCDPQGLMLSRQPETALQALMEAAPGDTPRESAEESVHLRDALVAALATIDAREIWVFTAYVNRGLAFRTIADELGISKSHAHRIYHQARQSLQDALTENQQVQSRLKREEQ